VDDRDAEFSAVKGRDYAGNLSALNEMVSQLRKYHKDMNTVKEKVDELLDSSRIRMSLSVRSKAVKLLQNLQNNCDVIAKALNEFSS
jgi:hypothetical protein